MIENAFRLTTALLAIVAAGGCQWHSQRKQTATNPPAQEPTPAAATRPSDGGTWEKKGVRLIYPAGWQPKSNPDYELMLVPSGSSADLPRVTLDIPDLPPHLPWMIQMNRIEHDYLADLKKTHPDLKQIDGQDVKIPNSVARMVRSSWRQNDHTFDDVVLFMIHANAVYILDARAEERQISPVRQTFDSVEASLKWSR